MNSFDLEKYLQTIESTNTLQIKGKVTQIIGLVIESNGPSVNLGELCYIYPRSADRKIPIKAEVVGFKENRVLLMPIGEVQGIGPGCSVVSAERALDVPVGQSLLGRILDGLGTPIDGKGPILSN